MKILTRHEKLICGAVVALTLILVFSTLSFNALGVVSSAVSEASDINYTKLIESINMSEVRNYADYLTSLGTRATGYPGNEIAAQFIYDEFVKYGLNTTFYPFTVVDCIDNGANITLAGPPSRPGQVIRIYPLLPNLVCPSTTTPEGITGPLIYASQGYLEDFDGLKVNGSIVLMDYYTVDRWINAAKFGAKAVIFIPPTQNLSSLWGFAPTTYSQKYLADVPLNFPRFFVESPEALTLMDWEHLGENVTVRSTQTWEQLTGRNVMAFLPGTDYPDKIVVLSSYYDSYSVCPSLAPGATQALGVAGLLELAHYLSMNPPKISVLFIAFGGHNQALTGAMTFVNDYLGPLGKYGDLPFAVGIPPYTGSRDDFGKSFVVQLNLDLSTGSNVTLFTAKSVVWGTQYYIYAGALDAWQDMGSFNIGKGYFLTRASGSLSPFPGFYDQVSTGLVPHSFNGTTFPILFATPADNYGNFQLTVYAPAMPWKDFAYDHEPNVPMVTGGYTFTTAFDDRPYYCEPFDTLNRIGDQGWSNLQTQLECIRIATVSLLNENMTTPPHILPSGEFEDPNLAAMMAGFKQPRESRDYAGEAQDQSWTTIKGLVVTWNDSMNNYAIYYTARGAKALVYMEASGWGITQGAWMRRFTFANETTSEFEFLGCSAFYGHVWYISPWVINSTTGNVIYAPDHGRHTWGAYPTQSPDRHPPTHTYDLGYLVMFKASTIVLFDTATSISLNLLTPTVQGSTPLYPLVSVNDFTLHLEPESLSKDWAYGPTTLVLAVPPNEALEIVWKFPMERYPEALLLNPSPDFKGYTLQPGEQLILTLTNLQYAETFQVLNKEHLDTIAAYVTNLKSTEAYKTYLAAENNITAAWTAYNNHEYSKAYAYADSAWVDCQAVYQYARPWIEDAASTVTFLAALLIPFVFLAEKLLFGWQGLKRVASFLGIFAFIVVAFYFLHPGFSLASSPIMIIIGFSTLVLSIPLLIIIFRYAEGFISAIALKRLGRHEAEVSRISEVSHAFLTGIEHMRKMKLRTTLTLVSIVVMVAALCSLTSISAVHITQPQQYATPTTGVYTKPLYEGIYIHTFRWAYGWPTGAIPTAVVELLKADYGENTPYQTTIAPRAWKYTNYKDPHQGPGQDRGVGGNWLGMDAGFRVYYNGNVITPPILWGLTPEDPLYTSKLSPLGPYLTGEWFVPGLRSTIILGESQAEALGINGTETVAKGIFPKVTFMGTTFTVIGILSDDAGRLLDLDVYDVNNYQYGGVTPIMTYEMPTPTWEKHVPLSDCLIMQYEDVIALGGSTASVSMTLPNATDISTVAEGVFNLLSYYQIYFTGNGTAENNIYLYRSGLALTVWGLQYQAIPMAVVALALFNIMLGTVHERRREIATYGTVGLSPLHVAFMFLAEAIVYALLGGIIGYLFAFVQGDIMAIFIPGVSLNYSSSWVVISVGVAMLATLLASLYPIMLASRLVTPSLERAWKVPTKPKGDVWEVPFPFFASGIDESGGIIAFLREYVEPHLLKDAPEFSVSNIRTVKGEMEGRPYIELSMDVRLFPYEMGIANKTSIYMLQVEATRWECRLVINRMVGAMKEWERLSRNFMDLIRKQMLLWRTLSPIEKTRYIEAFKAGGGS